jgi:hypothetical protein
VSNPQVSRKRFGGKKRIAARMSLGQAGFQMLILTFKVSGTNQKGVV